MSASITATGTWTALDFDATNMGKDDVNVPRTDRFQGNPIKTVDLPELTQFVQAMADGYGIGFNLAKSLFFICVTAFMNRETPAVSRLYAP